MARLREDNTPMPARDVADYIREAAGGMAAMAQEAGLGALAEALLSARRLADAAIERPDPD